MIFIDATNLFYRLRAAKLRLAKGGMLRLAQTLNGFRRTLRAYAYTSEPEFKKAQAQHDAGFTDGVRLVFGDAILKGDGNYKEKGVDALLVADLVYHAAVKNIDFAVVVSADTDFVQALRRVEDFGCRTAVIGVCDPLPQRLADAADHSIVIATTTLIEKNLATATE